MNKLFVVSVAVLLLVVVLCFMTLKTLVVCVLVFIVLSGIGSFMEEVRKHMEKVEKYIDEQNKQNELKEAQ